MNTKEYQEGLAKLNTQQKLAVESTEGPVMVIAGPGTGKTQVLTLRIAHILHEGLSEASGILCLTFTRSGVSAMQSRLEKYIGTLARDVRITTFHSFAIDLVEKNYALLDFDTVPKLLEENETIFLIDELLESHAWEYLTPRTDKTKYFRDLTGLISFLKRERITPADLKIEIEQEIKTLMADPDNLSSRGATKGQLKKEIEKRIDSLNRTSEIVTFYTEYEKLKKENNFMDYNDVLEYAVLLVSDYEDVRMQVQENYLYVLVDEHQDSNNVQNSFLTAVWANTDNPVEKPNIFVVGDDRQLIYGFSGANLDYFTDFQTSFGHATRIVLSENYRSTGPILALADDILKSTLATEPLASNKDGVDKVMLSEFEYNRDELIGAGLYFKKLIDAGVHPQKCALLLPKNKHVKNATTLFRSMGLPVVSEMNVSLLDLPHSESLLRVLQFLVQPTDSVLLSELLLDKTSHIPPLFAHTFLKGFKKIDELSLETLIRLGHADGLFGDENPIALFGVKLKNWVDTLAYEPLTHVISLIGNELLIEQVTDHDELLEVIEVVRTYIHSVTLWEEKNPTGTLGDFLEYLKRLKRYGNQVSIARLGSTEGIAINTFHKSKGLEYEYVWIGHVNEEIIMSEKTTSFTLPETIKEKVSERTELSTKRELYVAVTRAERFCTISFALHRDDGVELNLAHILSDVDQNHFIYTTSVENEERLLTENPKVYALKPVPLENTELLTGIQAFVKDRFTETKISVSMLNNFFECPWKWYFRNFLRLPEVKSVSLVLGSVVHGTIEYILKSETLPSKVSIQKHITYELEKEKITNTKDATRLAKDAESAITHWVDVYYKNLTPDHTSERNITYKDKQFPNLLMHGKIDLTERYSDGSIVVTDFKTGTSKTSGMIEKLTEEGRLSSLLRQLAMYSYLISGAEGFDVSESRLLFLEEDSTHKHALYKTHVERATVNLLIQDIRDYQELLLNGEWVKRPCTAQSYGTQTECESCARINKILNT